MAYGMVNTMIIGNVGTAEVRKVPTANGEKEVLDLSVAVNRKIIGKGAGKDEKGYDKQKVEWYRVKSWLAGHIKLAEWLTPGLLICVCGEQEQVEYDKRDGGGRGMSVEIRPSSITLLGKSKRAGDESAGGDGTPALPPNKTEYYEGGSEDGNLPF